MIDFGQCTISPLDVDMANADDSGFNIKADLFHLHSRDSSKPLKHSRPYFVHIWSPAI